MCHSGMGQLINESGVGRENVGAMQRARGRIYACVCVVWSSSCNRGVVCGARNGSQRELIGVVCCVCVKKESERGRNAEPLAEQKMAMCS